MEFIQFIHCLYYGGKLDGIRVRGSFIHLGVILALDAFAYGKEGKPLRHTVPSGFHPADGNVQRNPKQNLFPTTNVKKASIFIFRI